MEAEEIGFKGYSLRFNKVLKMPGLIEHINFSIAFFDILGMLNLNFAMSRVNNSGLNLQIKSAMHPQLAVVPIANRLHSAYRF